MMFNRNNVQGLLGSNDQLARSLGLQQTQCFIPTPTMSIEDKKFILMQVGCNNLLGVFDTYDEALETATKFVRKTIAKLHIFELNSTVESEHKFTVTQSK